MNRGEIWWAHVGNKRRPVLIVTRNEVIDVRSLVMVASLSPQIPKENNNLAKITQVVKKGKKKQDMPTV